MKVNTKKIQAEMRRTGINLKQFGERFDPPKTKHAVWYIIHYAKKMTTLDLIGEVLGINGRDLIE
jgi:hypothetical protein